LLQLDDDDEGDQSLEADELLLLLLEKWDRAFSFSVIECAVLTLYLDLSKILIHITISIFKSWLCQFYIHFAVCLFWVLIEILIMQMLFNCSNIFSSTAILGFFSSCPFAIISFVQTSEY
jgi:hypothetical protein